MQRRKSTRITSQPVSLAAALFGWPAAPGHSAPDSVPDAWLLLFREQHAASDPEVLSGIFRSCKSGRDWVLDAAPQATLTLDFTQDLAIPIRLQKLCAARQALSTRGSQPTKLSVLCSNKCTTYGPFSALPHILAGSTQCITELSVSAPDKSSPPELTIASAWLTGMAAVCPQLTSLTVDIPCYLPPPSALPKLTHLNVTLSVSREFPPTDSDDDNSDSDEEPEMIHDEDTVKACASVSTLLPHITSLNISFACDEYDSFAPWERIFTAQHTTHTLTHLTTPQILNSNYLEVSLAHAPALTELTVGSVLLYTSEYKQRQWAVRRLHIDKFSIHGTRSVEQLIALPSSSADQLCVEVDGLELAINSYEGLGSEFMLRTLSWRFNTPSLTLTAYPELPDTDHPTALRNALRQLSDLQVCGATQLQLKEWKWGAGEGASMSDAVLSALPTLPQGLKLSVYSDYQPITDESLGAILRMGSNVFSLTATHLALQSDTHANTLWPWDKLTVRDCEVGMLIKLPSAQGRDAKPRLLYHNLHVKADVLAEEGLAFWLSGVNVLSLSKKQHLTFDYPASKKLTKTFAAQVRVVEAVTAARPPGHSTPKTTMVLNQWPLTKQSMTVLQGLPNGHMYGAVELDLCSCTWPLKPAQYKQLAKHVPDEYELWSVGLAPEAVVDSICAGINECRLGKRLPSVKLVWLGHQGYYDKLVGECVIGRWAWTA